MGGLRVVEKKGSAKLYFDGASQNNPQGMDSASKELTEGLIEGLVWATRLDLTNLTVVGDSELIIKQLTGEYSIRNHPLIELHGKVQDLLRPHDDLVVTYQHIPREENHIADSLANQAIATRVNVTTCNWTNINRLMSVDR